MMQIKFIELKGRHRRRLRKIAFNWPLIMLHYARCQDCQQRYGKIGHHGHHSRRAVTQMHSHDPLSNIIVI